MKGVTHVTDVTRVTHVCILSIYAKSAAFYFYSPIFTNTIGGI